jgi:glycosyltransferase involved in cell wall biosynthesis
VAIPVVHTLHLPAAPAIARAVDAAPVRPVVACVSEHSAAGWRALTDVDVVLRNGVPVERIPWSERRGSGAVFAGRLSPEKGAAEAIAIAARANIALTVIGDAYDTEYAKRYIEPHADTVEILPAVPRDELWQRMSAARVVLCPVSWDEPFGLVGAEAQACGTPVVGFARGALPEVIVHGETGYLVDDVDAAVAALQDIDGIDRAACRAHAETDLSLQATLDAHEALYASLARVAS